MVLLWGAYSALVGLKPRPTGYAWYWGHAVSGVHGIRGAYRARGIGRAVFHIVGSETKKPVKLLKV